MPFVLFIIWVSAVIVWITLFVRSHQLLHAFRDRYAEEAGKKIKYAHESYRHPSKFWYFISADSAAFLEEKKDGELLARRRSVVRLSIAALAVPFGSMALLIGAVLSGLTR
jgi:hypothetical protein